MRVSYILWGLVVFILASINPAFAQDAAHAAVSEWNPMGAGLGVGIAAFGGALGQGKIISAALESIGRNPGASGQMFLPWILGVVFVESLVIYALVIGLKLVGII